MAFTRSISRWPGGHHLWQVCVLGTEAYLIEDGRVTAPVKGATLIGNGPETMRKVKMVGHDWLWTKAWASAARTARACPVGVGQPSLLIDQLTVGGTRAGNGE